MSNCTKLSDLGRVLTEKELDEALKYLYIKATMKIYKFVSKKTIEKEGFECDGIIFAKSQILEGQELRCTGPAQVLLLSWPTHSLLHLQPFKANWSQWPGFDFETSQDDKIPFHSMMLVILVFWHFDRICHTG